MVGRGLTLAETGLVDALDELQRWHRESIRRS